MTRYEVECEVTYRTLVTVEASSRDEARRMAERGPHAWLDHAPLEHVHTEAGAAWRQEPEPGEDEMQSWRDKQEEIR